LDDHGICCAIAEHLAGQLGPWVLDLVFWYFLLGWPGLPFYAAIVATSRSLAHDDGRGQSQVGWHIY
jgi:hypothetical protein